LNRKKPAAPGCLRLTLAGFYHPPAGTNRPQPR
jgi:hypothetical protein